MDENIEGSLHTNCDICSSSRFIQTMSEGLSEVGQARSWIHLALEKKMLCQHLKELLTNQKLLRSESIHRRLIGFIIKGCNSDRLFFSSLTGSCTNLMHSCCARRRGSSFCSTCCLWTPWTTCVLHGSSPPSVSPVNFRENLLVGL